MNIPQYHSDHRDSAFNRYQVKSKANLESLKDSEFALLVCDTSDVEIAAVTTVLMSDWNTRGLRVVFATELSLDNANDFASVVAHTKHQVVLCSSHLMQNPECAAA